MLKFEVRAAQEKPHDPQNTEVFLKIAFCFFRGHIYVRNCATVLEDESGMQDYGPSHSWGQASAYPTSYF